MVVFQKVQCVILNFKYRSSSLSSVSTDRRVRADYTLTTIEMACEKGTIRLRGELTIQAGIAPRLAVD